MGYGSHPDREKGTPITQVKPDRRGSCQKERAESKNRR
jgi:hypothetical protein